MAIKIKVQKDYFRTEVALDYPIDVSEVNQVLQATNTTGKMIVVYDCGHIQGVNIEQNSKISDEKSTEIRKLLGIGDERA